MVKDGIKLLVDNAEEQETLRMLREYRDEVIVDKKGKKRQHTFQECADYLTREGRKNKFGGVSWYQTNCRRQYHKHYCSGKNKTIDEVKNDDVKNDDVKKEDREEVENKVKEQEEKEEE